MIAATPAVALCLACEAPESTERPSPPAPPAASVDESPAPAAPPGAERARIDLGSKRKTALVEAFYPVPLAEGAAAAKIRAN